MVGEIKILGAGISGLTAAINLAKGGFEVTVFERASSVGSRFHNDFQGLENWSDDMDALEILKELSIQTSFWNKGFNEVSIYTDLKKEFIAKNANNLFYLVERGPQNSLDEDLKNQAFDAGVKIKFNSKKEEECDIIATGVSGKKPAGIVRGIVFDTDSEDSIVLILNDKIAFKGYAYLLIADGRATMACVVLKDLSRANLYFENSLKSFTKLKRMTIKNEKSFGGYGTFSLNKSNIQNQKLFVGEAAGFQDLFLGFGMKYAFLSGYIAAKSIIEEKSYDRLWKELFLNKLMASASNRLIYEISGERGYNYIANQLGKSKNPKLWLKNHYNFGSIKKLIYPLAKYTRL
jgi:flavin-dependent dehydrogenase